MDSAVSLLILVFGGIILVFVFPYFLGWLPSRDAYPANVSPGLTGEFVAGVVKHGILPAFSIVIVAVSGTSALWSQTGGRGWANVMGRLGSARRDSISG